MTCIVPNLYPQERIKRESGVNPEQSRCCKLHNGLGNTIATVLSEWEGAQNGSKSEDLQGILFRRLRGKAGREDKAYIAFTILASASRIAVKYLFLIILP